MASRRNKNSVGRTLYTAASPILRDWAALTWRLDTIRIGGLPRYAWNWILLASTLLAAYLLGWGHAMYWLSALLLGFIVTLSRSLYVMRKRRARVDSIIEDTRRPAGHPRSTTSKPVDPATLVKVRRWGAKNVPIQMDITVNNSAPAAPQLARGLLETVVDKIPHPHTDSGGGWTYTTTKTGKVRATAVPAGDERLFRQREQAFLRGKFIEWFGIKPAHMQNNDYRLDVTDWITREHPTDGPVPAPAEFRFAFGGHPMSSSTDRDKIERACDQQVKRNCEWIYQWDETTLTVTAAEPDSAEARRKHAGRWVADLAEGQSPRTRDPVFSEVTQWQEETHGDPWVPTAITIEFGSGAFTTAVDQRECENAIDDAMAARFPGMVWVYEWTMSARTLLECSAFPPGHTAALRKAETKRLRSVVDRQFGGKRDGDLTVEEWSDSDEESPTARPQRVKVDFGTVDVSKPDTQLNFESHWDTLYTDRDWNYQWRPAEGHVLLTAVPALPSAVAFPDVGTDEFDEFLTLAQKGKIRFGPRRRGGDVVWDMAQIPHVLIGGSTGAGKSYALGLPLFAALYQPDFYEVVCVDPKRMDWLWVTEFPNCIRFGAEIEDISECIEFVNERMDERQERCGKRGVRNLQQLRDLYKQHPEWEEEDGPAPRRLVFIFDEITDYLAKGANSDVEELKDKAKAMLERLGRLARAFEINLVTAAQKPDASIISSQFRGQLGFRLCVGPVDLYTSQQIVLDKHGTMFPVEGSPKGLAWAWDSANGYRMVQVAYLPNDTDAPSFVTAPIEGQRQRIRRRIEDLGYEQVHVPNKYGGREPRWVLTDTPISRPATGREPAMATAAPHPTPDGADDEWDSAWEG